MVLSDKEIRRLCTWDKMIEPFSEPVSGNGIISYGLTSAGYDMRLGNEIWIFKNTHSEVIDPKKFKDEEYCKKVFDIIKLEDNEPFILHSGGYILAESYEYFRIPRNIKGTTCGKSTYARSMVLVNVTPAEPEWEGKLTIEIGNVGPCHTKIYCMQGIAQMEFHVITGDVEQSYRDKKGSYQNQKGVTPSSVK